MHLSDQKPLDMVGMRNLVVHENNNDNNKVNKEGNADKKGQEPPFRALIEHQEENTQTTTAAIEELPTEPGVAVKSPITVAGTSSSYNITTNNKNNNTTATTDSAAAITRKTGRYRAIETATEGVAWATQWPGWVSERGLEATHTHTKHTHVRKHARTQTHTPHTHTKHTHKA